jgi:hypothetical protein
MKKLLSKKIAAFIVMAMMFTAGANAQIFYMDINPDTSIIRTRLNLRGHYSIGHNMDINNDGILDLKFTLITSIITGGFPPSSPGYVAGTIKVTPLNGSAILTGSSGYPAKLNLNDSISASANWSTTPNQLIADNKLISSTTVKIGNWNTATDGFLGLRFITGGQTHYCYIRMNAEVFSSGANAAILTMKDFAYNSIPNQPILVGDMGTGPSSIKENALASAILLFPNPASSHVTIDLGHYNQQANVTITDINGKIIYVAKESATQQIVVNTSALNEGIYLIRVQSDDIVGAQKLIIRK